MGNGHEPTVSSHENGFPMQGHSSVFNVKALVGAFNQEDTLVGSFSVIVKIDGSFAALLLIQSNTGGHCIGGTMTRRVHLVHLPTQRYVFMEIENEYRSSDFKSFLGRKGL